MEKNIRKKIYNKYNGKCAYCGKDLDFNNFHIDHLIPLRYLRTIEKQKDNNKLDNLLPTFPIINNYKRYLFLEDFRKRLENLHQRLKKLPKNPKTQKSLKHKEYLLNIANLFDINENKPFKGLFYFEKLNKLNNSKQQ